MIPIAYEAGWLTSVTFVSALSLWALVSGHWSAWQAARVEVKRKRRTPNTQSSSVSSRRSSAHRVDPAPKKTETIIERSEEDATPQEDDRN
jgi:hypothetical protein